MRNRQAMTCVAESAARGVSRDHSTFTKNRERLIEAGRRARSCRASADQHSAGAFPPNISASTEMLIEAWPAVKSMRRTDGKGCSIPILRIANTAVPTVSADPLQLTN